MKTLILIDRPLNANTGGGAGYLYKLKSALSLSHVKSDKLEVFSTGVLVAPTKLEKLVKSSHFLLKIYKIFTAFKLLLKLRNPKKFNVTKELSDRLSLKDYNYVHVHHLLEAISVNNYFLKNNIKSKIIYTPHDPGPTSYQYENYFQPYSRLFSSLIKKKMFDLEKEVFKNTDFFVFPSQEALNYYTSEIDNIDIKRVYFVPTGTDPYVPKLSRSKFLSDRKLPLNRMYFSFAGRHNLVKGYDILKEAASLSLTENTNIGFLNAGVEGPFFGLNHSNWYEEGWTKDPASLVNASDVFIAPNRKGYFDLVILEAMSLGKIVLATKTGGAIDIAKYSKGVILVEPENPKAMKEAINSISSMKKSEIDELCKANHKAYVDNFSIDSFGSNYIKVLNKIHEES